MTSERQTLLGPVDQEAEEQEPRDLKQLTEDFLSNNFTGHSFPRYQGQSIDTFYARASHT